MILKELILAEVLGALDIPAIRERLVSLIREAHERVHDAEPHSPDAYSPDPSTAAPQPTPAWDVFSEHRECYEALRSEAPSLVDALLGSDRPDEALLRFVLLSGRWDGLTSVYELVRREVQRRDAPVLLAEQKTLNLFLDSYNRNSKPHKARWIAPAPNDAYDFRCHDSNRRGGPVVAEVLLSGLASAAGELVYKPYVRLSR